MIGTLPPGANSLSNAQNSLYSAMQRLNSGQRINSAKDDAAGLAIASAMAAQMTGSDQAMRNVYDGISLTQTADGALSNVSDSLQRMRELTVQAANGTNSPSDLRMIQEEISQLGQGITQLAGSTQFNGQNLLDGSFSASIQSGGNAGQTTPLNLGNVSAQALGISGLDVTSQANATSALGSLDSAINAVQTMRSDIGAAQAGLNSTLANLSNTYENLAASRSRITDTDYAKEASNQSQSQVLQQSSLQALALYNANQRNVLSLLKG